MRRRSLVGLALAFTLVGCDSLTQPFGAESWATVAPGDVHTCALTDAAAVSCWGDNTLGQLGTPTVATFSRRPLSILLGPIGVSALSSGATMSCALFADQRALCWGANTKSPVVAAGGRRFRQVAVGLDACGLTVGGEVWCWSSPATPATQVAGTFSDGEVASGWDRGCVLASGAGIWCWTYASWVAAQVPGTAGLTYHGLTMGDFYGCAIGDDGVAQCWGTNTSGQLGDNSYTARTSPVPVVQGARVAGDLFRELRAYGNATCGVTVAHAGYCWGKSVKTPAATPVITTWSTLAPGLNHICGFAASDGELYCYGANDFGQVGDGTIFFADAPVRVIKP